MAPVAEQAAPTADQPLVSQPDTSALFMATRSDLRLVWESIRTIRDAEGVAVDKTPGKTLAFKDNILRVPLDPKGEVELTNGEKALASDALRFLERHRLNGNLFEGFWRVDPTAPPPSPQELQTLQNLALELDEAGLRAFIEQESQGWNRDALLNVARGTLERLQALGSERQAAVEEAREQGRKEAEQAKGPEAA